MSKSLQHIILSILLLLTAGVREGLAQTIDADLNDKYYTNIGNTVVSTLEEGKWYCIKAAGASDNTLEYVQGGSTTLVSAPSQDGKAALDAGKFFKVVIDNGNTYLVSGTGYYLQLSDASQNTSGNNGPKTYSYSATMSWVTSQSSASAISYTSANNIQHSSSCTEETGPKSTTSVTVYSYLAVSGTKNLAAYASKNDTESSNKLYQFEILPVTFTTKYLVTYNFQLNGVTQGFVRKLVAKDSSYPWITTDDIAKVMSDSLKTVNEQYELDDFSSDLTNTLTTGTITAATAVNIPLKTRVTKLDQVLKYATVTIFEDETKDLNNFITAHSIDNPTITYTLIEGDTKISLSDSKIKGLKAGSAKVKAVAAGNDTYNSVEVTIPITVTGYTDNQKTFIHAYDSLAAYKDKIGIRLGQYTYKKSSTSTNDNAEFTDMIFAYINQRDDVRSYTDRELEAAAKAIWKLKDDIEGKNETPVAIKLTLNLPTPGTLLKMKTTAANADYIGAGDNKILYFFDPANTKDNTTKGNLVTYDTGYYLLSGDAISSTVNDEDKQEYTFTANDATTTDAIYTANSSTYYLEDVDSLPVVISSYGYATLYTPAPLQIPNAIKAYVATAQSGINITLTRIRGIVPRGTALVLVGAAGTYQFPVDRTTTDAALTSPLKGTYPIITTASVGSSVYTLQPYTPTGGTTTVGFYPYSGTGKENITHFKCYFTNPASAKLYTVTFEEGSVDGIEKIAASEGQKAEGTSVFGDMSPNSTAIYDLQGRRIANSNALQQGVDAIASQQGLGTSLPRGLYIIGGKKVVIR